MLKKKKKKEKLASQQLMVGERKKLMPLESGKYNRRPLYCSGSVAEWVRRSGEILTRSLCLHTEDRDVMPEELLRLVRELGLFLCLLKW